MTKRNKLEQALDNLDLPDKPTKKSQLIQCPACKTWTHIRNTKCPHCGKAL